MKKYLYLVVLVLTLSQFNSAESQTFADINNDTTFLRKITLEEGARADMPIYFDTTGIEIYDEGLLGDNRYFERFYSKFGVHLTFDLKYFKYGPPNFDSLNSTTQEIEIIELFDKIKTQYGNFYLNNVNSENSFDLVFENHINVISAYNFLLQNKKNVLRNATYTNLPAKPVNSIEKDIYKIKIFPNPVNDVITLDIKNEDIPNFHYEILDITGNKILDGTLVNSLKIDVSKLSKGTYILKFNSKSQKFIKE